MFKQLISNLPFNPSLFGHVAFYIGRLKKETALRRLGFIFVALAMLIQMIAVISPPQKSLAASNNHIINGVTTRDSILGAWDFYGSDVAAIYGAFGVTRDDIARLPQYPNTTISSNDGNSWWTTGRSSLYSYSNVNSAYQSSEIPINVGPTTIYMRDLRAWDIVNSYNTYSAWEGTKSDGSRFWILQDCGNYTQMTGPAPKTPGLELRKSITPASQSFKPGDTYTYRFEYRNPVPETVAKEVYLYDNLDFDQYTVQTTIEKTTVGGNTMMMASLGNVPYSEQFRVYDVTIKLNNPMPNNNIICNSARIRSSNGADATSQEVCVKVEYCPINAALAPNDPNCKETPPPTPPPTSPEMCALNPSLPKNSPDCKPCPYNPNLPIKSADCSEPIVKCEVTNGVIKKGTRDVSLTTNVISTNQATTTIKSYAYNFGDGSKVLTQNSAEYTNIANHSYGTGNFTAKVVVNYAIGANGSQTPKQVECSSPIDFEAEKPVSQTKSVKNITQGLDGQKALNSTVKPDDVIEYKLTTINSQAYSKDDYVVEDYIGDVLDYADLDMASLEASKAVYNKDTRKIVWPKQTINAKTEINNTFRVKIKNPIPTTNAPSAMSTDFDCKITNQYGVSLTMNVSCPVVKGIETLPNTGPGTSLIVGFTITTVVGYFFARSRLLAKELEFVKHDYVTAGV